MPVRIITNRFKRHRLIATTNLIKIENRWRGISLDAVVEVHSDSNYEETRFFITDFNLRHLRASRVLFKRYRFSVRAAI